MTSRDAGPGHPLHSHCAFVDASGDGATDTDASHFHRIVGGRIRPDESDGHTHTFVGLPCGAGAVLPMPTQGDMRGNGMAGPFGAGPSGATTLAMRRAQTRMNIARQALALGNCRLATAGVADASMWMQSLLQARAAAGLPAYDPAVRSLMLDLARLRIQVQRRCSRR